MIPDLKAQPMCICPIRDAAAKFSGRLALFVPGFAAATRSILALEREMNRAGAMIEFKTYEGLVGIDYAAIEHRIMAHMLTHDAEHPIIELDSLPNKFNVLYGMKERASHLSAEEFGCILQKLPAKTERDDEEYKRKPWLRMQDNYDRQKARRVGRPTKKR